ncbi:uncharacterized protein [Amphiura filiformis]|uniref:uncharacterized protein n=1 Tax=Amphiura filiformis TaxID=82378 RepID=UPI003B21872A
MGEIHGKPPVRSYEPRIIDCPHEVLSQNEAIIRRGLNCDTPQGSGLQPATTQSLTVLPSTTTAGMTAQGLATNRASTNVGTTSAGITTHGATNNRASTQVGTTIAGTTTHGVTTNGASTQVGPTTAGMTTQGVVLPPIPAFTFCEAAQEIYTIDLATGSVASLGVSITMGVVDFALDGIGEQLYFTDGNGAIQRCNLDGTGLEIFLSNPHVVGAKAIATDELAAYLFFTAQGGLYIADMLGFFDMIQITALEPSGIAVDEDYGWLFYVSSGTVTRMDVFDGSEVTIAAATAAFSLAFDPIGRSLYFNDNTGALVKLELNGQETNLYTADGTQSDALLDVYRDTLAMTHGTITKRLKDGTSSSADIINPVAGCSQYKGLVIK